MNWSMRPRWFAAGVAVALVCGGAIRSDVGASLGTGERSVFVPITPCRLFDTRPGTDTVGPRTSPLGPAETFTIQARGPQGKCDLPADATAVAMNVAAIGGTAGSFLTVFPAGTDVPLAANLNWVAGQPPTPNKVDVGLSADGRVSFYNYQGTVNVAADVTGYYVDHHHDDRYYRKDETYTKGEVNAKVAALATGRMVLIPDDFAPESENADYFRFFGSTLSVQTGTACFSAPAPLPDGATITGVSLRAADNGASAITVYLFRDVLASTSVSFLTQAQTTGASPTAAVTTLPAIAVAGGAVVNRAVYAYGVGICMSTGMAVEWAAIDYTLP